jgi:hypothetical protein
MTRRDFDLLATDMKAGAAPHRQADEAVGAEPVGVNAHARAPGQAIQRQRPDRQVVHAGTQRLPTSHQAEQVRVEDAAADFARLVQIGRVEQAATSELDAGKAATSWRLQNVG